MSRADMLTAMMGRIDDVQEQLDRQAREMENERAAVRTERFCWILGHVLLTNQLTLCNVM